MLRFLNTAVVFSEHRITVQATPACTRKRWTAPDRRGKLHPLNVREIRVMGHEETF